MMGEGDIRGLGALGGGAMRGLGVLFGVLARAGAAGCDEEPAGRMLSESRGRMDSAVGP